jgi:hypothetical protein
LHADIIPAAVRPCYRNTAREVIASSVTQNGLILNHAGFYRQVRQGSAKIFKFSLARLGALGVLALIYLFRLRRAAFICGALLWLDVDLFPWHPRRFGGSMPRHLMA